MAEDIRRDPFEEYLRDEEPGRRELGYAWYTAIGLQAVDGLKTSDYLKETAVRNIVGEISLDDAEKLLNSYYEERRGEDDPDRTEEADQVSLRISRLLSESSFSFTPNEYISIHRKLFSGIYSHAGKVRDYNITKKEWVLDGASVTYGSASELMETLKYDLTEEKKFSYKKLSQEDMVKHLAGFVSRLWQIHVFAEGNTRTTAVFFIKYLRTLGFDVTNDIFAENAWYFRNAMVRANYNDLKNGIHETTEYIELFLRNLLMGENNELHNRSMHIRFREETGKADIEGQKADIEELLESKIPGLTGKTKKHVTDMFLAFGDEKIFGRSDVEKLSGLKTTRTSELLKMLCEQGIIAPVKGYGKGKYRFTHRQ